LISSLADVRQAYGTPDVETRRTAIYTRRGIGFEGRFDQFDPFVWTIFVFTPGTAPDVADLSFP
jgi:hypothetical protein